MEDKVINTEQSGTVLSDEFHVTDLQSLQQNQESIEVAANHTQHSLSILYQESQPVEVSLH